MFTILFTLVRWRRLIRWKGQIYKRWNTLHEQNAHDHRNHPSGRVITGLAVLQLEKTQRIEQAIEQVKCTVTKTEQTNCGNDDSENVSWFHKRELMPNERPRGRRTSGVANVCCTLSRRPVS